MLGHADGDEVLDELAAGEAAAGFDDDERADPLAALGPRMTEVAGEVSDGILLHGLSSERFVREVTLPALERGLARAGRKRSDVELTFPALIATGDTAQELAESEKKLRQHFAFYASTPAYSAVLELHGWGGLQRDLYELTRDGR